MVLVLAQLNINYPQCNAFNVFRTSHAHQPCLTPSKFSVLKLKRTFTRAITMKRRVLLATVSAAPSYCNEYCPLVWHGVMHVAACTGKCGAFVVERV